MKILKATQKQDSQLADSNIKHISIWDKEEKSIRLFIDGERTALFSVELSRGEIERILRVYQTGKSE